MSRWMTRNGIRVNQMAERIFDCCPPQKVSRNPVRRQSQSGQIVLEYVLLLVIAVAIALLMTRAMIGRTEGEEGFIIKAWQELIEQIGADYADDLSPDGT